MAWGGGWGCRLQEVLGEEKRVKLGIPHLSLFLALCLWEVMSVSVFAHLSQHAGCVHNLAVGRGQPPPAGRSDALSGSRPPHSGSRLKRSV